MRRVVLAIVFPLVIFSSLLVSRPPLVDAANFETSKVIIHKPTYSENSHFGFSVAGYKLDKDAW